MSVTHSTFRILSAIAVCILAGCGGDAVSPRLFDQWRGEEPFAVVETAVDTSPSGKFAVEYAWDDPDTSGKYRLSLRHEASGRRSLLGRGTRGASCRWWKTRLGDVLTVEYQEDTHFSRVFVLYPHLTADGRFECPLLYATPSLELFPGPIPPEHIYAHIVRLTEDGMLTLSVMWDYGKDGGTEKTVEVPLFYGIPSASR